MEKLDRMHCYHRRRRLEFFFWPAISFRKCIPALAIKECDEILIRRVIISTLNGANFPRTYAKEYAR